MQETLTKLIGQTEVVCTDQGDVVVRELCIEDLQLVFKELSTLLGKMTPDDLVGENNLGLAAKVLADDATMTSLKTLCATVTDKDRAFYDGMPLKTFLKIVTAFFKVNSVEELKTYFFELRGALKPTPPKKTD